MQRLAPNNNHQFMNALREQGIASSQELLSLEEMSPNKRKRLLVEIAKLQDR